MAGERMLAVSVYERACFETFSKEIYPKRLPAVLKGLNLGPATHIWSAEYLKEKVGKRNVKLHLCPTDRMDFVSRNFVYKTLPFDEFITRASRSIQTDYFICKEEKYYLRSLGEDPRKNVAKISTQFPELAEDIVIPELFPLEKLFSSVFRVGSAGIHLWTHYDVIFHQSMMLT
jgi:tRNA wybutosine-synthesizing protein 5